MEKIETPDGRQVELPRLVIELKADGSLGVTGPIDNKTLCYGMLEAAKDAVREFVAKMPQGSAIEIPRRNGLPPMPKFRP